LLVYDIALHIAQNFLFVGTLYDEGEHLSLHHNPGGKMDHKNPNYISSVHMPGVFLDQEDGTKWKVGVDYDLMRIEIIFYLLCC
jgi:hypothetical protein